MNISLGWRFTILAALAAFSLIVMSVVELAFTNLLVLTALTSL